MGRARSYQRNLSLTRAIATIAVWLIAFLILNRMNPVGPPVAWDSTWGQPIPDSFLYLMFPVSSSVPVFDAPEGKQVGVLTRAAANSHAELNQTWFRLVEPRREVFVRATDLTFALPPNSADLVAAYSATYSALNPSDFRTAGLTVVAQTPSGPLLKFNRGYDDGRDEYEYGVGGAVPVPNRFLRWHGPTVGLTGFVNFLVAAVVAFAAYVGVAILQFVLKPRR